MAKGLAPVPSPTVFASIKRFKRTILDELKGLDDPRNKREPNHLLSDMVTIAILATLCGADNMVAVETYGREKQDMSQPLRLAIIELNIVKCGWFPLA